VATISNKDKIDSDLHNKALFALSKESFDETQSENNSPLRAFQRTTFPVQMGSSSNADDSYIGGKGFVASTKLSNTAENVQPTKKIVIPTNTTNIDKNSNKAVAKSKAIKSFIVQVLYSSFNAILSS
jgi:hypothetical protein